MLNFANTSRSGIFTKHLGMTAFIQKELFRSFAPEFWEIKGKSQTIDRCSEELRIYRKALLMERYS